MLEVGDSIPQVRLPDQDGTEVDLQTFKGQPVVVYFYPKDDTPGCTIEACGIRDQWSEFEAAGAAVFGVSADDVDSHAAFADKYDLPHRLLADPGREVIEAFGAYGWRTRSNGERVQGVKRVTVLVDQDGNVARVWPEVDPAEHADELLAAIRSLPS